MPKNSANTTAITIATMSSVRASGGRLGLSTAAPTAGAVAVPFGAPPAVAGAVVWVESMLPRA
jgi:hypothetical protein